MLCTALTALSIFTGACLGVTPQALQDKPPSFSVELARKLINKHRVNNGRRPLTINPQLMAAARGHSKDMARRGSMSHKGSNGSTHKTRARRAGYKARLVGENVAAGYNSTADVIKIWKNSRGHNANLLMRGAKHMGMALVNNPKTRLETYWTLMIGKPR